MSNEAKGTATPRPWYMGGPFGTNIRSDNNLNIAVCGDFREFEGGDYAIDDAKLIVTAVNERDALLARVERLEQALRKIEHPAHLLNEFMPNCAGCIARAALNDEEATQPDFQGKGYVHACDFDHGPVCVICGEPSKEVDDGQ